MIRVITQLSLDCALFRAKFYTGWGIFLQSKCLPCCRLKASRLENDMKGQQIDGIMSKCYVRIKLRLARYSKNSERKRQALKSKPIG